MCVGQRNSGSSRQWDNDRASSLDQLLLEDMVVEEILQLLVG